MDRKYLTSVGNFLLMQILSFSLNAVDFGYN